jgi:GNAT superfamily N-acetyltransferase
MSNADKFTSSVVTIRLATAADALSLAKLRFDFRSAIVKVNEDEAAFLERCAQWMSERLSRPSGWKCWLAELDGRPVGHLWAQLIEKVPNPTTEPEYHAYITNLFVSPEARGAAGSRLLAAALAWIEMNDVHAVILWPTERSRSLYQRYGFTTPVDLMELLMTSGNEVS